MLHFPDGIEITIKPGTGRDTTTDNVCFLNTRTGATGKVSNALTFQPSGIKSLATALGIKKSGNPDFTFMMLNAPSPSAAVFTRSLCPGHCITHNKKVMQSSEVRAIAVNSGNANVFTPHGDAELQQVLELIRDEFDVPPEQVLYCSTGVIGIPLPLEKFREGIPGLSSKLQDDALESAARAILTTDRGTKVASVQLGDIIICGMAKGAGMIEPNMATMLCFLFTNARLTSSELQACLEESVGRSFNCISVDSDTSTSDVVSLHSTSTVELSGEQKGDFRAALHAICLKLARDVVSQGEGVERIIQATVHSNVSDDFSRITAKKIINSPLVKTAIHGADPNWGRIVMAVGKPAPGIPNNLIPQENLQITIQGVTVFNRGAAIECDQSALAEKMRSSKSINIDVTVGQGGYTQYAWGCDLSADYVRINADYTT